MVYGNLYVVLVGPPGNRKTTAMTVAKKVMREIGGIPFSAEAMTREGLIKAMTENEQVFSVAGIPKSYVPMTVCVTELKEFMGSSNEKMINFLTTIYDQDFFDYKTRNMEDLTIVNPYLTILACETPEWITLRLRDDMISGGFSRRAIWVYPPGKHKRIAFPKELITSKHTEAWAAVIKRGQELRDVSGEFTWTPEAKLWYKHWYETLVIPPDSILAGYYDSKQIQLLKIAMLVAVSESSRLVLEKEYLLAALDILDEMEKTLPRVFEGMGRNELNSVSAKILDILNMGREMSEKELRSVTWRFADDREFQSVMDHLIKTEKVTIWKERDRKMICMKGQEPPRVKAALENLSAKASQTQPAKTQTSQESIRHSLSDSPDFGRPDSPPTPLPAVSASPDVTPKAGPPSGRKLTQQELLDLLREGRLPAPSGSFGEAEQPPKGDQSEPGK
jgi:hypothetical protein